MTPLMIHTHSGRLVHLDKFTTDDVVLSDIAKALGSTCRYNGHTEYFYSVAEHSVYVSRRARELAAIDGRDNEFRDAVSLAGLLHDAAEAYVGDIPTPIKVALAVPTLGRVSFQALENGILNTILDTFHVLSGLRPGLPLWKTYIKRADQEVLYSEVHEMGLLPNAQFTVNAGSAHVVLPVERVMPQDAYWLFVDAFSDLSPEV